MPEGMLLTVFYVEAFAAIDIVQTVDSTVNYIYPAIGYGVIAIAKHFAFSFHSLLSFDKKSIIINHWSSFIIDCKAFKYYDGIIRYYYRSTNASLCQWCILCITKNANADGARWAAITLLR